MGLYRRPDSSVWWVRFVGPNGGLVRRSSGTSDKRMARVYLEQQRGAAWRADKLGERPRVLWSVAAKRWLVEAGHRKSLEDDKFRLRWCARLIGALYLDQISRDVLDKLTAARVAEGVSSATVNRTLEVVRAVDGREGRVFRYEGEAIARANTRAWRKALARAGISDFRWHDLRHTWASWHVQSGTPLEVLQVLGGWSSHDMVLRYAHLAPSHVAAWAGRVSVGKPTGASAQASR